MAKQNNPYMGMVYQSFLKQGLSPNQARAMTAEVGRENDFNPQYLFGTHGDKANGASNLGMFSWQKERRNQLANALQQRGLLDKNGNMERSQRSLDTMAEFALNEIKTNKAYEETRRKFLANPNVDYATASRVLGKNYVRWDYDGKTLGRQVNDHHAKRDRYFQALGGSGNIQAATAPSAPQTYSHNGLRLKSNEAVAGGAAHQGTYALAHALQNQLGNGLKYFTAFNDSYHLSDAYFNKKGNRNPSVHSSGLAMDIVLSDPKKSAQAMAQIRQELNAKGLKEGVDYKVLDEYANPSSGATGGHLDLRFLSAAAAERYHKGGTGAPTTPTPAMANTGSVPSLNFNSSDLNFSTAPLQGLNTDIQAATPQQDTQAENPLSSWNNALSPTATAPKTALTAETNPTEKWKIQTLKFDEPKTSPDPYAAQYAAGFGEVPDTPKALPDYLSELARHIYDNA